jgi:hypothetical protein
MILNLLHLPFLLLVIIVVQPFGVFLNKDILVKVGKYTCIIDAFIYSCLECGFNCHAKCEMKVMPNCGQRPESTIEPTDQGETIENEEQVGEEEEEEIVYPILAEVLYDYDAQTEQELSVNAGGTVLVLEPDCKYTSFIIGYDY